MGMRDQMCGGGDYTEAFRATRRLRHIDQAEIQPSLRAIGDLSGKTVLELGCGTGRFTAEIAKFSKALIAVDFSVSSLQLLAGKITAGSHVGLVQADVTDLAYAPGAFDVITSTLVSNLPTKRHRGAMYGAVKTALALDGRFVFSVHHWDLRTRLMKGDRDGRYSDGGIYRRLFAREELVSELEPFFSHAVVRPIVVTLPGAWHLGLPLAAMSSLLECVPFVNQLGFLLLAEAALPRH